MHSLHDTFIQCSVKLTGVLLGPIRRSTNMAHLRAFIRFPGVMETQWHYMIALDDRIG